MKAQVEEIVHRALVAAHVSGVLGREVDGVRVRVQRVQVEGAAAGARASADVVVVIDGDADLPFDDESVTAVVVGSPGAAFAGARADAGREDAYGRAMGWGAERAATWVAPMISGERLAELEVRGRRAGLVLVEPEVGPGLSRVRGMRGARGRALLATVVAGAAARPLLFVPANRAPKNGLVRPKVERLANGWVRARSALASAAKDPKDDLVGAAIEILRERDDAVAFKDLLREARGRVTASTGDTGRLAGALYRLSATEDVELFALDPAAPAWTLTGLE